MSVCLSVCRTVVQVLKCNKMQGNDVLHPKSDWRCFMGCAIGVCRIFFQGANSGMQKSWLFSHPQNTGLTAATNAPNTLQHFQGASVLKTFHFWRGAFVRRRGAPVTWHNGQSKPVPTSNCGWKRMSPPQIVTMQCHTMQRHATVTGGGPHLNVSFPISYYFGL